jgi:ABC-type glutathione transport system ATPase component
METIILQEKLDEKPELSWSQISVTTINRSHLVSHEPPNNLLTHVSGIAQNGKILAIMGTSGVGKSTSKSRDA